MDAYERAFEAKLSPKKIKKESYTSFMKEAKYSENADFVNKYLNEKLHNIVKPEIKNRRNAKHSMI